MPMKTRDPSKAEAVALFRLGVIGDLLARELSVGELHDEIVARARQRYRPPGASTSRTFHWKTLESWYYEAHQGGHQRLIPTSRRRGFALDVPPEQRTTSADLILQTALEQGIVAKDEVSTSTLRRLFAEAGVPRTAANRADRRERRRWEAARTCALWHADVAHVWVRDAATGEPKRVYVHGILDDHSRYVFALEARTSELEVDMLSVLCGALLRSPAPEALYLDNGPCYRGDVLALACARLDIRLVHAKPHDPQARGKMERSWRTMRHRCTDHMPIGSGRDDVIHALLAFLDADYHTRPYACRRARRGDRR